MNIDENNFVNKKNILDEVAETKREQFKLKKEFSNAFIKKFDDLIDRCFLKQKDKLHHLISKEKLVLEMLQLLQSQKKFKDSILIHNEIASLAVFDIETSQLGKIININIHDKTVEYQTYDTMLNNKDNVIKKFDKIDFFDPYSVKMSAYWLQVKHYYDCYKYVDMFEFLTGKEIIISTDTNYAQYSLGRGVPLDRKIQERVNNLDLVDKK